MSVSGTASFAGGTYTSSTGHRLPTRQELFSDAVKDEMPAPPLLSGPYPMAVASAEVCGGTCVHRVVVSTSLAHAQEEMSSTYPSRDVQGACIHMRCHVRF